MSLKNQMKSGTVDFSERIDALARALEQAETVVIGAGAGLSTSAGFVYSGPRFEKYFSDFGRKYGFSDMYSGGFYPYSTLEERWAFWSRNIYVNRYLDPPEPVYAHLLELVQDKDYFVLTTNVDHCFQKAGFDKKRLFYTQGDYGLWQCSEPCHEKTYDNEETVRAMIEAQGFVIAPDGALYTPDGVTLEMTVPSELVPHCPVCGKPMSMNLRADNTFVEDETWHQASERCNHFLNSRGGRVVYLELGVGYNTPGIIKYPFWQLTMQNPQATYAIVNFGQAQCPAAIEKQSICLDGDIGAVLEKLRQKKR